MSTNSFPSTLGLSYRRSRPAAAGKNKAEPVPVSTHAARSGAVRHPSWTIALHWASVLALLVATAAILLRMGVEQAALRVALMEVHRQAGLVVLLALGLRLAVRAKQGLADTLQGMPTALRWSAHAAHGALYVALAALPLLGWAASSARAIPLTLFGLWPLPALLKEDADSAETLGAAHEWAAWGLLALVVVHAGAALWHHWVRRDGVLHAMLPVVAPRPKSGQ